MGTGKSGRYLNTQGSGRTVSDFAVVHSMEGRFKITLLKICGKKIKKINLAAGGHGQKGMVLLDKYGIKYHIVKTYENGVRIGYVPCHGSKLKRQGIGQSWFPIHWTEKDIKRAGAHVAGLTHNRHVPDGVKIYGNYKGVRVGVIRTYGKIATVFPDTDQTIALKRRRKAK